MEVSSILFLIVFVSIFAGMIYLAIRTSSNDKKEKQELASALGFTPIEAHAALLAKISQLYQRGKSKYEMRNVFHKKLPDGEMYLFDLVETSGEDDSWTETQAVAIISSYLKLPHFALFPKADQKYALSGVANKILEWGVSFVGKPIPFPEFPAFNDKYVVTSNEPDLTRIYLDANLLRYFSQTQMYMLHAYGRYFHFQRNGSEIWENGSGKHISPNQTRHGDIPRIAKMIQ